MSLEYRQKVTEATKAVEIVALAATDAKTG